MWPPLFIFCVVAPALLHAHFIHEGVYFSNPLASQIVTSTHHLVLKLDLKKNMNQIDLVKRSITDAIHTAPKGNPFTPSFQTELRELALTLTNQQRKFNEFINTQENTSRTKRTPLIGTLFADLLGLPTNDEITDIIHQINSHENQTQTVLNRVVSALSITDKQVRRLTSASAKAATAIKGLRAHVLKLDQALIKIDTNLIMAESLNFLEFAVSRTLNEITRIISVLDRIKITKRITTDLLSPHDLEQVLRLIQNHNIDLLFPATPKYLPLYYRIAETVVTLVDDVYYIIVRIPLKTEGEYLLYEMNPFWVPYMNSSWSRKIEEVPSYLAVRKDQKLAFELKDLKNCIVTEISTLCVPDHNTYSFNEPTCALSLFKGKENVSCAFSYKTDTTPYFTRIDQFWIGSVHTRMTVEEVCDVNTESRTLELTPGINKIPIRERCQIVGETFTLPKYTIHGTTVKNITIVYPPYQMKPERHLNIPHLQSDRLEIPKPMKETDLRFLTYTSQIQPHQISWHTYTNSTIIFLVICFILVLIFLIKCRYRCYDWLCNRAPRRTPPRPHTPVTPNNTRTPTATPARTPTPFPQHIPLVSRMSRVSATPNTPNPKATVVITPTPTKPPRGSKDVVLQIPNRKAPSVPEEEPAYLEMNPVVSSSKFIYNDTFDYYT